MHTPKPQIQGMEPRRGRLGARTLPYDCGVKRRIKGFWWCLDVFGREIRERRERIFPGNYPKSFFFFFCKMSGLGACMDFDTLPEAQHTLYALSQAGGHTRCARSTRLMSVILSLSFLSVLSLTAYLNAFLDFD